MDWGDLRIWDGSQNRAFELLCGQLVASEPAPPGSTFIPKAAPDAGIECYWKMPNGDEWAWQAKFFKDSLEETQWRQMDNSVQTALTKHPRITRYTFCLPKDREDPRIPGQQWFMDKWNNHVEKWEELAQQQGLDVLFTYWGESEIVNRLSQEVHAGRYYFWFNQEHFHNQWFKDHIEVVKSNAGPRYSRELNVDIPIVNIFDGLSRVPEFVPNKLKSTGRKLERSWQKANQFEWRQHAETDFNSLELLLNELIKNIGKLDDTGIYQIPLRHIGEMIEHCLRLSSNCISLLDTAAASAREEEKRNPETREVQGQYRPKKSDTLRSGSHYIALMINELDSLLEFVESSEAKLANVPALLLVGDAGTGKTHLLCDIAKRRFDRELPTIVLLGEQFNDDEPWTQIIKLLGLSCSRNVFLGALEALGQSIGSRVLLFIDAINEGEGKRLWHNHLAGMLTTLVSYPWVGIAISVRTSYEPIVVPSHLVSNGRMVRCTHQGFSDVEYDATQKFFEYYKILSPTIPFLMPEFRNPQFLKLFCDGLNKKGLRTIPSGFEGITSIIKLFIEAIEDRLWKPDFLDYDPSSKVVQNAVRQMAEKLAETGRSWLPREEARELIDALLPGRNYDKSLFSSMLSEGIIAKDMHYTGRDMPAIEGIHFSYDRLTDHLIASYLIDKYLNLGDPTSAFSLGQKLNEYLVDEGTSWKYKGLIEAFSIQIPEKTGKELTELAPNCSEFGSVQESFIQSLIWRKPETIQQAAIDYINSYILKSERGYYQLNLMLLTVAPRIGHPLNAKFLHRNLKPESLPDRDVNWSIFLHHNYDSTGIIQRLIDWAWFAKDKQYADEETIYLTAITIAWFFTSSNRFIRDRATKALVSLLETRIDILLSVVREFTGVNDPYVSQRVYAVAYGCALRSTDKDLVANLAIAVYELIFKEGKPPTDILLRDYARGIIEVSLNNGSSLPIEPQKVKPPYNSEWFDDIPSEQELRDKYYPNEFTREPDYLSIWNSVMGYGDFARYTIGTNSGSFEWSSRRLGFEYELTKKEQYHKFLSSLTNRQEKAFTRYDQARRKGGVSFLINDSNKMEFIKNEIPEDKLKIIKEESLQQLRSVLGKKKRNILESVALPYLDNPKDDTLFDLTIAQRWILNKVIELGWTPELFGEFERFINYHDTRQGHKIERIGKKYQWIAYYEFLARVSDNFQWKGSNDGDDKEYQGPWQFWRRDIDPSFLLPTSNYIESEEKHCWWFDVEYNEWLEGDDIQWLQQTNDMPDILSQIQVTNPIDTSNWLLLGGTSVWGQPIPPGDDKYEIERKEIWNMFKAYLVKKEDADILYEWMKKQNFMGRWMPADSGENGHDSVPNRPPVRSNRPPSGKSMVSGAWVTIV